MTELVVFPDAVATVITYLKTELVSRSLITTDGIGTRLPTPLPTGTFVRIFRTGGLAEQRVLDKAQLTIEVYAADTTTAHDVAQTVRALIHAAQETVQSSVPVHGVAEFSGPQDFPDPLTDKPRYTFTVQVTMRGSAA